MLSPGRYCNLADCPSCELPRLMGESSWQRKTLGAIKSKLGYKLGHAVYSALDQINCSNLYSYIDERATYNGSGRKQKSNPSLGTSAENEFQDNTISLNELNMRIFGPKRKFTFATLVTRLVLVHCCCCTIGMSISTFFQYKHDYYKYHLNQFKLAAAYNVTPAAAALQHAQGSLQGHASGTGEKLALKVREAKEVAKLFGSFLVEHSFLAQSVYILMMLLCLFTYFGPMLVYHFGRPLDFHYLRLLLDWDQEQRNCNQMLTEIISRMAFSSGMFTRIAQDHLRARKLGHEREPSLSYGPYAAVAAADADARQPSSAIYRHRAPISGTFFHHNFDTDRKSRDVLTMETDELRAPLEQHNWTVKRLRELALAGRLQPLDRCDVDEIARASLLYAAFASSTITTCYVWNISLFSSLPLYFNFHYELDLMDTISLFELATLNALLTIGGAFYLSLALVHCYEQVRAVRKLCRMIGAFLVRHRRMLDDIEKRPRSVRELVRVAEAFPEAPPRGTLAKYHDEINTDLLLILMHYKIIRTQTRLARRTFGFVLLCCLGMATVFPIIGRLHVPYLSDQKSKILSVVGCCVMVALADLAIVPMCWMNSRSLSLCHSLWSLMALLIDISANPRLRSILCEHSIWMLRKEMSHPEQLRGQFAILMLGVEFTYSQLLKLHFWLGFLIISFNIELRASPNSTPTTQEADRNFMTGSLFSDPLGIKAHLSI